MNNNRNYTIPIILVTSLFFLWGLAYGLLDVLNKHFQETLNITKQRSTLLQAAYRRLFFDCFTSRSIYAYFSSFTQNGQDKFFGLNAIEFYNL